MALKYPMTGMPQMVALLNGFGGAASALVAVVLAMVNVVGGFVVTHRMLEMFNPKKK